MPDQSLGDEFEKLFRGELGAERAFLKLKKKWTSFLRKLGSGTPAAKRFMKAWQREYRRLLSLKHPSLSRLPKENLKMIAFDATMRNWPKQ